VTSMQITITIIFLHYRNLNYHVSSIFDLQQPLKMFCGLLSVKYHFQGQHLTLTLNFPVSFTIIITIDIINYTSAIVLNNLLNFIFQFTSKGHIS
jgi:hypothetical protein